MVSKKNTPWQQTSLKLTWGHSKGCGGRAIYARQAVIFAEGLRYISMGNHKDLATLNNDFYSKLQYVNLFPEEEIRGGWSVASASFSG